jgi:hypothetical protein
MAAASLQVAGLWLVMGMALGLSVFVNIITQLQALLNNFSLFDIHCESACCH